MPDILSKVPFCRELLSIVQNFECGDEEWEKPLAEWIKTDSKSADCAIRYAEDPKSNTRVWLYFNQLRALIGYSSLGTSKWSYPNPDDERKRVNIIPNVAIHKDYQGKPKQDPPKYSTQILDDLKAEARKKTQNEKLLVLFVDPRNIGAIKCYEREGFEPFNLTYPDRDTGITYVSRLVKLE